MNADDTRWYNQNLRPRRKTTPLRSIPERAVVALPTDVRLLFVTDRYNHTRLHLPVEWTRPGWRHYGQVLCGVEPPKAWGSDRPWAKAEMYTLRRAFEQGVCGECLARMGFARDVVRRARDHMPVVS